MDVIKRIEKDIKIVDRAIDFEVGDTVKVHYKIIEGNKERIQVYEGIVIAIDNKGISKTFTVRKISFDVGVERIFPLYSPKIAKIEVIKKGKKRQAKLYYLRDRKGKSAKLRERKIIGKKDNKAQSSPAPATEEAASAEAAAEAPVENNDTTAETPTEDNKE